MSQTFSVRGMKCRSCEQHLEEALESVDGTEAVTADHESGTVTVEGAVGESAVSAAIAETDYDITA